MQHSLSTPVIGFAGFSGSGKTTLLECVIPHLKAAGLRVGLLKHSHHDIEPDSPRKDSYRLRYAGSDQLLLATSKRHMLFFEYHDTPEREPSLHECLIQLDHSRLDIILVEGFRDEVLTKIEVYRPSYGKPKLHAEDANIVAVASDEPLDSLAPREIHSLNLNNAEEIALFVRHWLANASDEEKYLPYFNDKTARTAHTIE
ncbi:molybdopterin-guanine dinucleotide biosynthesis protein B [Enterovibrio sp. ZSDZ42]|uniref:Molybdopterin-guanine dinucleotide biosynthesis protein B n=1 Tax=Enterovibrio gelatinilyticus TaxID=2899819 RepID=A0ABT5R4D0_9GAMM|nr:molybdopterin-guanine dinucleotide biosynthesis protein B [Enterovibrio sp. ZSDZ42]MDD1795125.1 molybdopterin-guanine dinucleotide biosynthesis protein B [Enterovibrio sp. ZSDZ42]